MSEKIVGHKTMRDGTHQPLYESEALEILRISDEEKSKRASDMPTEQDAIDAMFRAWQRLKELGWREAIYCPKDGTVFDAIEPGSTGIHKCSYSGEWPKGSWWIHEDGDMWPSRPALYRSQPTRTNFDCPDRTDPDQDRKDFEQGKHEARELGDQENRSEG